MQNTSHAVMAQRKEAKDSLDDFPTPPWASRALVEHVIEQGGYTDRLTALEPACGVGHMSKVLREYFGEVDAYPPVRLWQRRGFYQRALSNRLI